MEYLARATILDVVLLAVWGAVVVQGVRAGLVRQLFNVAAIYVGVVFAGQFHGFLASFLERTTLVEPNGFARPVSFLAVLVSASVLFRWLAGRAYPHTGLSFKGFDAVAGGVSGAVLGVFVVILLYTLIYLFTGVGWPVAEQVRLDLSQMLDHSATRIFLRENVGVILAILQPWLPRGMF